MTCARRRRRRRRVGRAARSGGPAGERGRALSARIQRRAAPAHRHRPRPRGRARSAHRRRDRLGARRLRAGADHQPAARAAEPAAPDHPLHRPRPAGRPPSLPSRRRDVSRLDRRDRRDRAAVRQAGASLHRRAARGGARDGPGAARHARRHRRRTAESVRDADRLRLPHALRRASDRCAADPAAARRQPATAAWSPATIP